MKNRFFLAIALIGSMTITAQNTYFVGGDISMIPKYEAASAKYYDMDGKKITNLINYFHDEAGFNTARVRLFVNPTGETGVCQDLAYVKALSKRIKDAGMNLMLDFHYSDTWADPTDQWTPSAWLNLSADELKQKIYDYTKEVLTELVAAGATPDFIQTGNEISYGMLWGPNGTRNYYVHVNSDNNWERFIALLSQAGKACREICPDAKIIIHTERTANWDYSKKFYNRLASLDYDIIGLSYYPEWHNNVTTLKSVLGSYKRDFPDKPVMIVETGYYNNWYPDNATYNFTSIWPASAAGQKAFLTDLVDAVKSQDNVIGILYWFPEENPYSNRVYEPWYNHGLFNPNNGKATEALFVLKTLNPAVTTIDQHEVHTRGEGKIFTIDGRELKSADNLPHGIYIIDGKKIIK